MGASESVPKKCELQSNNNVMVLPIFVLPDANGQFQIIKKVTENINFHDFVPFYFLFNKNVEYNKDDGSICKQVSRFLLYLFAVVTKQTFDEKQLPPTDSLYDALRLLINNDSGLPSTNINVTTSPHIQMGLTTKVTEKMKFDDFVKETKSEEETFRKMIRLIDLVPIKTQNVDAFLLVLRVANVEEAQLIYSIMMIWKTKNVTRGISESEGEEISTHNESSRPPALPPPRPPAPPPSQPPALPTFLPPDLENVPESESKNVYESVAESAVSEDVSDMHSVVYKSQNFEKIKKTLTSLNQILNAAQAPRPVTESDILLCAVTIIEQNTQLQDMFTASIVNITEGLVNPEKGTTPLTLIHANMLWSQVSHVSFVLSDIDRAILQMLAKVVLLGQYSWYQELAKQQTTVKGFNFAEVQKFVIKQELLDKMQPTLFAEKLQANVFTHAAALATKNVEQDTSNVLASLAKGGAAVGLVGLGALAYSKREEIKQGFKKFVQAVKHKAGFMSDKSVLLSGKLQTIQYMVQQLECTSNKKQFQRQKEQLLKEIADASKDMKQVARVSDDVESKLEEEEISTKSMSPTPVSSPKYEETDLF